MPNVRRWSLALPVSIAVLPLTLASLPAFADENKSTAAAAETRPAATHADPLLSVDRHRNTIVERIAGEWGDALAATDRTVSKAQLRELLQGLRADDLLAASMAGSLEGLRDIVAGAVNANAAHAAWAQSKALGDPVSDLVYTPVAPCRILDTRGAAGGALQPAQVRNWLATNPGGNFTAQGGAASNCGITVKPAAVMINFTLANTTGAANFVTAWPFSTTRPNAAALNWTAPGQQIANAIIVAMCLPGCADDFSTYASAQTDLIGDIVGYFAPPGGTVIGGGGSTGILAKWISPSSLGNSVLAENSGNVGLGTFLPNNRLQIGVAPGFSANDLAIGNGTKGMSFFQTNTASTWFTNTNFVLQPFGGGNGFIGWNTSTPINHLELGPAATHGFSGNDIAFSSNGQASGFAQGAGVVQWTSTTDMILMPRGTGHGRVGINTATPGAPLDVDDSVDIGSNTPISIQAAFDVLASNYVTASDARLKDVIGASNSSVDLDTLMRLEVADYTLKAAPGSVRRPFKKLVAQQVETVYPQVVARHAGFVPDVDQAAHVAAHTDAGILLRFERAHGLDPRARRLKLVDTSAHATRQVGIVAVPSAREILIEPTRLAGEDVFVYGRHVDDLRSIDYDGLSTLNISATQELARRLQHQHDELATLAEQNALLRAALAEQSARLAALEAKDRDLASAPAALRASR